VRKRWVFNFLRKRQVERFDIHVFKVQQFNGNGEIVVRSKRKSEIPDGVLQKGYSTVIDCCLQRICCFPVSNVCCVYMSVLLLLLLLLLLLDT